VWHFGDALNLGPLKPEFLKQAGVTTTVAAIAADPAGVGYWLVTRSGTVFNFGLAPRLGATTPPRSGGNVVGVAATSDGAGLWVVSAAGGVASYGDASPEGSLPRLKVSTSSVVGVASL
jgi:hypothetical protein